ncbi:MULTISPECIES: dethiobiotin synthase [Parachlamydia]|uniref:ATP-dependent dethiobiotin synthetase BioD n=2 Tax=Parachlamydia acanthamoebae TaxID=83552 RepID=F8KZG5_PARAV|nr:dethiobiotin synthase [Parachlamydia acanthamoebae]EFB41809.1 hypothetical protein pah_c022o097 [Parachlamydia acanthamoebae str. Hall's coccus]CCB86305.1 dethiobiotin synthetase [Parachlamydia acanthamoebae UV-7]
MHNAFPSQFFVTGTGTDVGKTVVSAILTYGLKAAYWKPIQTGSEYGTDTFFVKKATQLPDHHFFSEAYCFSKPLSPHAAAKLEGVEIDLDLIKIPQTSLPHLILEGAGGILVPLNSDQTLLDLLRLLNIPILIVASTTLGTINHTLMTIECLRNAGISILGVVMNGPKNDVNAHAISHYGKVTILAEIEPLASVSPQHLLHAYQAFC